MEVDDTYLNELLKYDFQSTKKGRGYSSLMITRKPRGQPTNVVENNQ